MPSKAYWLEEPWIMVADYWGRVTVTDFEQVMEICLANLKNHRVYFVVDITQSTAVPLTVTMIPSLVELVKHPNTAAFAWVGANRFSRITIPTFIRKPNRFFDSREEALAYLRERIRADEAEAQGIEGGFGR